MCSLLTPILCVYWVESWYSSELTCSSCFVLSSPEQEAQGYHHTSLLCLSKFRKSYLKLLYYWPKQFLRVIAINYKRNLLISLEQSAHGTLGTDYTSRWKFLCQCTVSHSSWKRSLQLSSDYGQNVFEKLGTKYELDFQQHSVVSLYISTKYKAHLRARTLAELRSHDSIFGLAPNKSPLPKIAQIWPSRETSIDPRNRL